MHYIREHGSDQQAAVSRLMQDAYAVYRRVKETEQRQRYGGGAVSPSEVRRQMADQMEREICDLKPSKTEEVRKELGRKKSSVAKDKKKRLW